MGRPSYKNDNPYAGVNQDNAIDGNSSTMTTKVPLNIVNHIGNLIKLIELTLIH